MVARALLSAASFTLFDALLILISIVGLFTKSCLLVYSASLLGSLIDNGLIGGSQALMTDAATMLIACSCIAAVAGVSSSSLFVYVGESLINRLKLRLIARSKDYSFSSFPVGYLMSRIEEADNLSVLFNPTLFQQIGSFLQAAIAIVSISRDAPLISLSAIILIAVLLPLNICANNCLSTLQSNLLDSRVVYTDKLIERLEGRSDFFYRLRSDSLQADLRHIVGNVRKAAVKWTACCAMYGEASVLLNVLLNLSVLVFFSAAVARGASSVGRAMQLAQYLLMAIAPVFSIPSLVVLLKPAVTSATRLFDLLQIGYCQVSGDSGCKVMREGESIDRLELQRVAICGSTIASEPLLSDISLTLTCPSLIIITGSNGSGKSAFAETLSGGRPLLAGRVVVDDIDVTSDLPDFSRMHISYLQQQPKLMDGTVWENILIEDQLRDSAEVLGVLNAFEISKIDEKVRSQKNRRIGLNGKALSGGEIQRIAIARTLSRRASLYILDEPTQN